MKTMVFVLFVLALAGSAYASDPGVHQASSQYETAGTPSEIPDHGRDFFYCQLPTASYYTMNASTGFASELADDIPDEFYCRWISAIIIYVGEWGAPWIDPAGIFVNFYSGECPPPLLPAFTRYVTWAEVDKVIVQQGTNSYDYEVTIWLCPPVHIEVDMSIGFVVDNTWGQNPPYCGVDYTNDYDVHGCGEMYIDHAYWGFPRWSLASASHGTPVDLAYCLGENMGPSAADQSTWSAIKSLYR